MGAWKNLNGLIVDVESVYVNGVHIDAVAEAALMIVKHECLAIEKVVGEDGDQELHDIVDRGYAKTYLQRPRRGKT